MCKVISMTPTRRVLVQFRLGATGLARLDEKAAEFSLPRSVVIRAVLSDALSKPSTLDRLLEPLREEK